MTLADLTTKLQTLCHEGHSLDEVLIDIDGKNEKSDSKSLHKHWNRLSGNS